MKKRVLKIAALLVALALLGGIGWLANGLVGNPVSRFLAERTVKAHLEAHYGETDFYMESLAYNFKSGGYDAKIVSPTSMDSYFWIYMDLLGRISWENYEHRVLMGTNTAERIWREYRDLVDAVLEDPGLPYVVSIGYGDIVFKGEYDYGMTEDELVLDQVYDIRELGARAGHLVVYVDDDTVTVERAAELILDIRQRMDNAGISFYAMDFVLSYPRNEDGTPAPEGRVEVMEFLYAEIYPEGMEERVRTANEEAIAYHAEQDAMK